MEILLRIILVFLWANSWIDSLFEKLFNGLYIAKMKNTINVRGKFRRTCVVVDASFVLCYAISIGLLSVVVATVEIDQTIGFILLIICTV